MNDIAIDRPNFACGLIFVLLGGFFGIQSLGLEIGTAFRMGPGYFPLVLAGVLISFGVVLMLQSLRMEGEALGAIAWRGMLFILPAPIFFGFTVRGLGFVPALFVTALIASFASRRMTAVTAVLLSGAITLFCTGVFSYGLGLPFQLVGPWIRF